MKSIYIVALSPHRRKQPDNDLLPVFAATLTRVLKAASTVLKYHRISPLVLPVPPSLFHPKPVSMYSIGQNGIEAQLHPLNRSSHIHSLAHGKKLYQQFYSYHRQPISPIYAFPISRHFRFPLWPAFLSLPRAALLAFARISASDIYRLAVFAETRTLPTGHS